MKEFKRDQRSEYSEQFKKHLLIAVLSRVDFQTLFSFDSLVGEFQKEFSGDFPVSRIGNDLGYDIDISEKRDPKISFNDVAKMYELINNEERKQTKFGNNCLILEYYKYVGFDSFKKTFSKLLDFICTREKKVIKPTRLGLRKVNEFILEENGGLADFNGYFNKFLIEHLRIPFVDQSLSKDRHFVGMQADNELYVNFQYGTDSGNVENKKARRFILDVDVYTSKVPSNHNDIIAKMEKMNTLLFDIFLWSIEDGMIKYLKEGEA